MGLMGLDHPYSKSQYLIRAADMQLPPELESERQSLIAEIHAAFEGVSRKGGVSWSEAEVIDGFGDDDERNCARLSDTDRSWTVLAGEEEWDIGPGVGGWAFLDPIGFRYYLPAAMIRTLHSGENAASCYSLATILEMRDRTSRLDERQERCVARFIQFMITFSGSECWRRLYASHWRWVR